jgi:hypothetical protein
VDRREQTFTEKNAALSAQESKERKRKKKKKKESKIEKRGREGTLLAKGG